MTTLDALGSNFCLVGNMETMHIDIVVSEHGKTEKKKAKTKGKRLYIEVNASEWSELRDGHINQTCSQTNLRLLCAKRCPLSWKSTE